MEEPKALFCFASCSSAFSSLAQHGGEGIKDKREKKKEKEMRRGRTIRHLLLHQPQLEHGGGNEGRKGEAKDEGNEEGKSKKQNTDMACEEGCDSGASHTNGGNHINGDSHTCP